MKEAKPFSMEDIWALRDSKSEELSAYCAHTLLSLAMEKQNADEYGIPLTFENYADAEKMIMAGESPITPIPLMAGVLQNQAPHFEKSGYGYFGQIAHELMEGVGIQRLYKARRMLKAFMARLQGMDAMMTAELDKYFHGQEPSDEQARVREAFAGFLREVRDYYEEFAQWFLNERTFESLMKGMFSALTLEDAAEMLLYEDRADEEPARFSVPAPIDEKNQPLPAAELEKILLMESSVISPFAAHLLLDELVKRGEVTLAKHDLGMTAKEVKGEKWFDRFVAARSSTDRAALSDRALRTLNVLVSRLKYTDRHYQFLDFVEIPGTQERCHGMNLSLKVLLLYYDSAREAAVKYRPGARESKKADPKSGNAAPKAPELPEGMRARSVTRLESSACKKLSLRDAQLKANSLSREEEKAYIQYLIQEADSEKEADKGIENLEKALLLLKGDHSIADAAAVKLLNRLTKGGCVGNDGKPTGHFAGSLRRQLDSCAEEAAHPPRVGSAKKHTRGLMTLTLCVAFTALLWALSPEVLPWLEARDMTKLAAAALLGVLCGFILRGVKGVVIGLCASLVCFVAGTLAGSVLGFDPVTQTRVSLTLSALYLGWAAWGAVKENSAAAIAAAKEQLTQHQQKLRARIGENLEIIGGIRESLALLRDETKPASTRTAAQNLRLYYENLQAAFEKVKA